MLIEAFIDSLRWSNRSISTVLSYRHDLISFLNHQEAPNDFTLGQFTVDALERYFLAKSECVKPATLARYQSSLRSFCRWLIRKNHLQRNPFDQIEGVTFLTPGMFIEFSLTLKIQTSIVMKTNGEISKS